MSTLLDTLPAQRSDRVLLEGPHSRSRELWLVLRALRDFIASFRAPCTSSVRA
jgi:hypothetical protein